MTRQRKIEGQTAENRKKWAVALYIRLSKEDGNEISNSVVNQEARLLQHLRGFDEEYDLEGKYIDDGYTGTDTNRDSFQRLISQIMQRKVNCVIVKDLSRLSRNIADASYYLEHVFVEYRVRFISLELPALDSYKYPEQMNSILLPIQSVINDDFCRQTSVKVRGVLDAKRREGQYVGAFGPHGYKRDPGDRHRLVVDAEAAESVRDIFRMYVSEGMSKEAITRRLNALGVPNPAEYKRRQGMRYKNPFITEHSTFWSSRTVTVILENEMYIGNMVQGRERIKSYKVHTRMRLPKEEWSVVANTHEAIISREMFEKAQLLLKKNTKTVAGEKRIYLLSGFCRCPDCHKALSRIGGGQKNNVYYVCSTYRNYSRQACTKHSIRIDRLEAVVSETLKKQIGAAARQGEITKWSIKKQSMQGQVSKLQAAQKEREKDLTGITKIKDSLYADWKQGFITQEDFVRMKADYEARAAHVRLAIRNLVSEQEQLREDAAQSERTPLREDAAQRKSTPLREAAAQRKSTSWLNRSLLADLVQVIYVHENGTVEIVLHVRDMFSI